MLVVKVHKQHNSLKMTIPYVLKEVLKINAGDYLIIDINDADKEAVIRKIEPRRLRHGKADDDTGRKDTGGQA